MGRIRRVLLSFAFTSAIALSQVVGTAADQAATTASPVRTQIDIDNFGQVNTSYYRGGQPDRDDFTNLAALGVKTVIDPANQPVFVHCAGGRHRTGVMTAVYRMHHDRWNAEQAFKEMKQYKFGADFLHPEFKRFVYAYHVEPELASPAVLATGVIASEPAVAR